MDNCVRKHFVALDKYFVIEIRDVLESEHRVSDGSAFKSSVCVRKQFVIRMGEILERVRLYTLYVQCEMYVRAVLNLNTFKGTLGKIVE